MARVVDKIHVVKELGKMLDGFKASSFSKFFISLGVGTSRVANTIAIGLAIVLVAALATAIY